MRKLKLIPNWKLAWKFASIRWSALGLFLMTFSGMIEDLLKRISWATGLPQPPTAAVAGLIFVLAILGRLFVLIQTVEDLQDDNAEG